MITLELLTQKLGYDVSPFYWRTNTSYSPETAYMLRSAENIGVDGIYVFRRAPESLKSHYIPAPAVYVAEAENETAARQIHRKLWNLCSAPFLIIVLPNQVRVYTGFNYSEKEKKDGTLDEIKSLEELNRLVKELNATAIDTGLVWKSQYAKKLDINKRVDRRLLKNIDQLGAALTREGGLKDELANRLIGKYIYLRYLQDRGILTNEWMLENHIHPDGVFSLNASVKELEKLINVLEKRFNGKIFPINFKDEETLKDKHVKWVAAIFSGAEIIDKESTPGIVLQLHLPFKAYDFEYIPVETLSSIYEQFIFDRKKKGAVYTPEALADYLIAEVESVLPLERGMNVLDPACGSGIFLALIFRLLIEKEIQRRGRKLNANELLEILEESICGVEREPDACYVAEFSLILTLLHYLEPRNLQNLDFRFPSLHNRQIFESDFFDIDDNKSDADFWQKKLTFDWIIGNPPWITLKTSDKKKENELILKWMNDPGIKKRYPVGDYQTAEAFSWLSSKLLKENGIAGLILPATSLFNIKAQDYRMRFFSENEILKVTNCANLRETINMSFPPAILIYRPAPEDREKASILHYGPFEINQLIEAKDKQWVITVNENEIKTLSPDEAETGNAYYWKLALWGNHIDRRIIERIKFAFPKTLAELCEDQKWWFFQGPELRFREEKLKFLPQLKGKKQFNTDSMRKSLSRYSIPSEVLDLIPEERCYIRRGEETGLKLTDAPHIILSSSWMSFILYSDLDFVIPPRQIGISASIKNDENAQYLKALSIYLSSRLVAYILFFFAPEWGVFRHARKITLNDVREIPTPDFTPGQVEKLAHLQEEIVEIEKEEIAKLISDLQKNRVSTPNLFLKEDKRESGLPSNLTTGEKKDIERAILGIRKKLQGKIDDGVSAILDIPQDIRQVVDEFFEFRLPLDTPSQKNLSIRKPNAGELENYARELKAKLEDFLSGKSFVRVEITYSDDLVECIVEVTGAAASVSIDSAFVKKGSNTMARLLTELADNLRRQISQWVYIRRGLRLFDGPKIHIYKTPRIIDWTRTQARIDAGDIIGELIQHNDDSIENRST